MPGGSTNRAELTDPLSLVDADGFKGSLRRCDSAFLATPLFSFANDLSQCVTPASNRGGNRAARFDARFVEFSADDGKRLRVEW